MPNVVCKIADGEMLVGFKDGTVDVVTCAHGVEVRYIQDNHPPVQGRDCGCGACAHGVELRI